VGIQEHANRVDEEEILRGGGEARREGNGAIGDRRYFVESHKLRVYAVVTKQHTEKSLKGGPLEEKGGGEVQ